MCPSLCSGFRSASSPSQSSALRLMPAPPKGEPTHIPDKALLCPTSPSLLRNATPSLCRLRDISLRPEGVFPSRGGSGGAESPASSPLRCEETSLPKAPLLGELANEVRLRGCTKDGLARPANGSPFGSNDDDRGLRPKQGGVVGAAASKTRVPPKARCGCWVPQPGAGKTVRF